MKALLIPADDFRDVEVISITADKSDRPTTDGRSVLVTIMTPPFLQGNPGRSVNEPARALASTTNRRRLRATPMASTAQGFYTETSSPLATPSSRRN
jgi:hypothetical protein